MSRLWRVLVGVALGAACLSVAGGISNAMSGRSVELAVVRQFLSKVSSGQDIRIRMSDADQLTIYRIRQMGAGVSVVSDAEWRASPYPFCRIEESIPRMPFVQSVYGVMGGGPYGVWCGRIYLFTFFGWSMPFWEETDWQT